MREAKPDFSVRFSNYHPDSSTLEREEILSLLKHDEGTYQSLCNFWGQECPLLQSDKTNVLVVGSGSGGLTEYIKRTFPNVHIIDFDKSCGTGKL